MGPCQWIVWGRVDFGNGLTWQLCGVFWNKASFPSFHLAVGGVLCVVITRLSTTPWLACFSIRTTEMSERVILEAVRILTLTSPWVLPWWLRWWRICLQCRRPMFDPWIRKTPWKRKWQPTSVFLPRKSHEQRSLEGYSPQSHKNRTWLNDQTTAMKICLTDLLCFIPDTNRTLLINYTPIKFF